MLAKRVCVCAQSRNGNNCFWWIWYRSLIIILYNAMTQICPVNFKCCWWWNNKGKALETKHLIYSHFFVVESNRCEGLAIYSGILFLEQFSLPLFFLSVRRLVDGSYQHSTIYDSTLYSDQLSLVHRNRPWVVGSRTLWIFRGNF